MGDIDVAMQLRYSWMGVALVGLGCFVGLVDRAKFMVSSSRVMSECGGNKTDLLPNSAPRLVRLRRVYQPLLWRAILGNYMKY